MGWRRGVGRLGGCKESMMDGLVIYTAYQSIS